eukprot:TRINITY_DN1973_c0_g5_i1.p1 TRINITY_DN1973_c0_g5~~TRINITY_DN1973_c0_g5_i1.p1  ORF type:complete len:330 (-),score=50.89 TRINITY_DN1973_c0_g5_i1:270-1148(-)
MMEAMYPEELNLSSWPPIVTLVFDGWESEIVLSKGYPNELPTVRVKPPQCFCDESELEHIGNSALTQLTPGESLLAELARLLGEEISARNIVLQSVIAEQRSVEEAERLRLQELQDRQLAHEFAQKERSRASQASHAEAQTSATSEEDKMPRFDFSNYGISTGEPLTDRKSTFLCFLWPVSSRDDVECGVAVLKSNHKIARAAHNMLAWRLVSPVTGGLTSECDSDGEAGAGGGLHHLLHTMAVENVAVMVTRWFGGIHLGPDRFKHINNCARTLLVREGYASDAKKKGKKR